MDRIGALKGGTHSDFSTFLSQNIEKFEGGSHFSKNFEKKAHNAEKTERGTLCGFSTSILPQNIKKLERGPFAEKNNFDKKVP